MAPRTAAALSPAVADALQRGLWRPGDGLPALQQLRVLSTAVEAAEHLEAVLTGCVAFRPRLPRLLLGPAVVQLRHLGRTREEINRFV